MPTSKITTPKSYCFVLMPFSADFDDIYQIGIKEACDKAGAYCERVDEQIFNESILDRVYNQIAKADIIIADMTGRNANVFYEVGYAHALGKLTILLTQKADDIPFDLKHFPHIVYETKISGLRNELEKRVRYFIENPPTKTSEAKIELELYLEKKNLASDKVEIICSPNGFPSVEITIFNSSINIYESGDYRIGVFTREFQHTNVLDVKNTKLPDNKYFLMMPPFPTLFPEAYTSFHFDLVRLDGEPLPLGEVETILLKLFTKQGSREFPIRIKCEKILR